MPSISEQTMMPTSARNRFVSTTLLIVELKSAAIPVCWTIPMMIPTHALAATKAMPFFAERVSDDTISGRQAGCASPKSSSPNMPTIADSNKLPTTSKGATDSVRGSTQDVATNGCRNPGA